MGRVAAELGGPARSPGPALVLTRGRGEKDMQHGRSAGPGGACRTDGESHRNGGWSHEQKPFPKSHRASHSGLLVTVPSLP